MLTLTYNKVLIHLNPPSLENSYYKTLAAIKSCKIKEQLEGASIMIENFKKMYKQVGYPKVLSYSLDRALKRKLWY